MNILAKAMTNITGAPMELNALHLNHVFQDPEHVCVTDYLYEKRKDKN